MDPLVAIVLCYLVAIFGGHVFTKGILKLVPLRDSSQGIVRAGAVIGFLERALIISFMIMQEYSLIGFIVAAKSIARFEELKERGFAEYFIVGTLASTLFAVLVGMFLAYYLGEL